MPRKRLPRGFYSPGSRGFIRVKNCELVEAKSSEREKVVVRLITDLRQFWTSLEVWSFIIFFFLSFLTVKYSDKFDRFEMKIWKWKSNDDANVVKYVTNIRAVSSNGELTVSLISERVKDYSRIRTHPISVPLFSFSPSGCLASKPLSTPLGTVASMKGETRGGQRGQLMPAGWNRERFIPWKQQGRCFLVCRESRASNHPVYFTCDPISLSVLPLSKESLFRFIEIKSGLILR